MMKRDRHVRGVASGLALVGPIYLDEARLGDIAIPKWFAGTDFATVVQVQYPPRTLPSPTAPVRKVQHGYTVPDSAAVGSAPLAGIPGSGA